MACFHVMRATPGMFAAMQAVAVAGASALGWFVHDATTGGVVLVGGACAWLGSMAYMVFQPRRPASDPWVALRAHLIGQVVKWMVAAGTLFTAMTQVTPELAGPLVFGFVLALLVHAIASPMIKSR